MPTIIIYWSPVRSEKQKRKVAEKITDVIVEEAGATRESVLIIFQNIEPGDAARAGKILLSPAKQESEQDFDPPP